MLSLALQEAGNAMYFFGYMGAAFSLVFASTFRLLFTVPSASRRCSVLRGEQSAGGGGGGARGRGPFAKRPGDGHSEDLPIA